MMLSFHSGFASDIQDMMGWRGTLGYTESSYMRELADFDRYRRSYLGSCPFLSECDP